MSAQNRVKPDNEDNSEPFRDSGNKWVDFPTSGNQDLFKIEGGIGYPATMANRSSHNNKLASAFSQSNEESQGTMNVQIFLNVEFDFGSGPELLRMNEEFPPTQMTIDSMIQTAVMVFNEQLETKRSPHRINPNFKIWNLCMSKKNGKPKQDLPALDRDNLLSESGSIDMFTLDTKESNKLILETSSVWIAYKRKEQEGDDDDENMYRVEEEDEEFEEQSPMPKMQKNQSVKTQSTNSQINESRNTETSRKSDLISSVPPKQKRSNKDDGSGSCSGLCSFSKKK